MLLSVVGFVIVSGFMADVPGPDHANCPMMSAHEHRAQVDARHDEATGVGHEGLVHHFRLAKGGGSIRLEVKDAEEREARDRVREHLQVVARSFAAGDFALPVAIHAQVPPGVEVMKARKDLIHYAYAPSEKGGVVRISTRDPKAKEAIHAFLRFQIQDHGTHDPAE